MPLRGLPLASLLAGMLVLARPAAGEDASAEPADDLPVVRPHAAIDVGPTPPTSARLLRRVDALVALLRETSTEHDGLSSWLDGGRYLVSEEVPQGTASDLVEPAERAFRELVALGPVAMPALLAHLDDPTPTKLRIEYPGEFGGMWTASSVRVNPALADETSAVQEALGPLGLANPDDPVDFSATNRHVQRHEVTVGDVCFTLLGHITNRPYEAVQSQPQCDVVHSPTRDPRIARAVRAQWEGRDVRRALARRLDDDLWTSGVDWTGLGALLRLLAWYPETVEGQVVDLLDSIDASEGAEVAAAFPVSIHPETLVDRAGTICRPAVQAALARLAGRARSAGVVRAALRILPLLRDAAVRDHVLSVIDATVTAVGDESDVRALLEEVEKRWPDQYASALRGLLRGQRILGVYVLVRIAHARGAPLAPEDWRRLLDVRARATERETRPPEPLERLRVCDVAAGQIARLRPELRFDEDADVATRDRQIEAMRGALGTEPRRLEAKPR